MKKSNLILIVLMFVSIVFTNAQGLKTVYAETQITFYGLDFTRAAFVGSFSAFGDADTKASVIRNKYMMGWNNLLLNERQKFNISEAYKKDTVFYNVDYLKEKNSKIDTNQIYKYANENFTSPKLTAADIQSVVNGMKVEAKTTVGLVYVVDYFNKGLKNGCIWVVFFDTKTKVVLHSEAFVEQAQGIGLRNFWGSVVFRSMESSKKAYSGKWKKLK